MINLCYTFSERNRTMHEVYIDHCTILSDLLPIEMSSTLRNSRGLTTSRLRTITIVGRFTSNNTSWTKAAYDQHLAKRNTHLNSMRNQQYRDDWQHQTISEITVLSFPFCMHNLIIIISTMKQNKRIYWKHRRGWRFRSVPYVPYVRTCLIVSNCKERKRKRNIPRARDASVSRARHVFVRSITPVRLYSSIMVSALCAHEWGKCRSWCPRWASWLLMDVWETEGKKV